MLLDITNGKLKLIDRQRDEAWILHDIIFSTGLMPDNNNIWFLSEESGFSHLYMCNIKTNKKTIKLKGLKTLNKGGYKLRKSKLFKLSKRKYSKIMVIPNEKKNIIYWKKILLIFNLIFPILMVTYKYKILNN